MTVTHRPAPDLATWREAIRTAQIGASTKLVCHAVAHYLRPDCAHLVRLSVRQIGRDTGLTSGTVAIHLRRAVAAGYIGREPTHGRHAVVWATLPAIAVSFGDPRWAAWAAHALTGVSDPNQALAIRLRLPLTVPEPWPTPSPGVEGPSALGLVTIPWGTPEHAAWLAHHRRAGNLILAQSADMAQRTLLERDRWPPVPTEPAAPPRSGARPSRPPQQRSTAP